MTQEELKKRIAAAELALQKGELQLTRLTASVERMRQDVLNLYELERKRKAETA